MTSQTTPRLVALVLVTLMIGAAGLSGCAQGDAPAGESSNVSEPDATSEPDANDGPDADEGPDAENEPDADDPPDSDGPPPPKTSVAAPSSGGARLQTPNHQIRLIVGPRGSGATLDTPDHRIRMGAGSVQHGQSAE